MEILYLNKMTCDNYKDYKRIQILISKYNISIFNNRYCSGQY